MSLPESPNVWIQSTIRLKPRTRGFHVVTSEIANAVEELRLIRIGLLHLFIQHTSASLTINENVSRDVRDDMEVISGQLVPDGFGYSHNYEGADDMPAHFKASMFGAGLTIPVSNGRLMLGTWQGIYLGEHRDHGGSRTIIATLFGIRTIAPGTRQ